MTNRLILTASLSLGAFLSGCGSKDLTRSKAADLIIKNKDFAKTIDVTVPVGNVWWDWRNIETDLKPLKTSGAVIIRETGQKEGYWNKEYQVLLTPYGQDVSKSWTATKDKMPGGTFLSGSTCWTTYGHGEPCHEAKGVVYSVELAHRKLDEVTGISSVKELGLTGAEFTWEWVPTDSAKTFTGRFPSGVQKGSGTFELYDDGWRLGMLTFN